MASLIMKVLRDEEGLIEIEMQFGEAQFLLEIRDLDVTFRHLNSMDRVRLPWEAAEYLARTILEASPLRGSGEFKPRIIHGGRSD